MSITRTPDRLWPEGYFTSGILSKTYTPVQSQVKQSNKHSTGYLHTIPQDWQDNEKQRPRNCLPYIRGDCGGKTITYTVVSWIRSCNRMRTLIEKLVKFKYCLKFSYQQCINFLVLTNLPWQYKILTLRHLDSKYTGDFFAVSFQHFCKQKRIPPKIFLMSLINFHGNNKCYCSHQELNFLFISLWTNHHTKHVKLYFKTILRKP